MATGRKRRERHTSSATPRLARIGHSPSPAAPRTHRSWPPFPRVPRALARGRRRKSTSARHRREGPGPSSPWSGGRVPAARIAPSSAPSAHRRPAQRGGAATATAGWAVLWQRKVTFILLSIFFAFVSPVGLKSKRVLRRRQRRWATRSPPEKRYVHM